MADTIGTAMSNPTQLVLGRAVITEGFRLIRESVLDIIGTSRGETFFNEDYGCRLEETLFLPNDVVTFGLIKQMVLEALGTYEKRIQVNSIDVTEANDSKVKCLISLNYTIITTNLQDSFIFPFYKELAS